MAKNTTTAVAPRGAAAQAPDASEGANKLPATIAGNNTELDTVSDDMAAAFDEVGTGLENVTARDLLIPRLTILQGLSPQVTQGKPEFDPDAKVGQIYDVGLREKWNELLFLPVHYVKSWLEWAPRASGKGLIAIHETDEALKDCEPDDKNRMVNSKGNTIQETAQLYGLNVNAGFRKSFMPMASTQLKKTKQLLTYATAEKVRRQDGSEFTPPIFYRVYRFTTVPESNNEGNWMGWKIERSVKLEELPNWRSLMADIKMFRDSLTKGDIRGDIQAMAEEAAGDHTRRDTSGRM